MGMAKDLYDDSEEVRKTYQEAHRILGYDLAQICFDGPEEELKQTRITQPAIFVHSAVLTDFLLKKGLQPAMAAGHSLGEYSALYAAGVLTFADGLRLVKVRAALMQKAGELRKGTMAAIIGLDNKIVAQICEEASTVDVVAVANFNSPVQTVISGSVKGVERAMEIAKERGAKRTQPLVVGGAFHSPLMEYAHDGLGKALAEIEFLSAHCPVYANVNALPVVEPDMIRRRLHEQLTSPVCWSETMQNMINDGARDFYEVGPGSVLTGLLRRISREVKSKPVNSLESLDAIE